MLNEDNGGWMCEETKIASATSRQLQYIKPTVYVSIVHQTMYSIYKPIRLDHDIRLYFIDQLMNTAVHLSTEDDSI